MSPVVSWAIFFGKAFTMTSSPGPELDFHCEAQPPLQALVQAGNAGSPETQNWPNRRRCACKRAKARPLRFLTEPNAPLPPIMEAERDCVMGTGKKYQAVSRREGREIFLLLRTVTHRPQARVVCHRNPDENRQIS